MPRPRHIVTACWIFWGFFPHAALAQSLPEALLEPAPVLSHAWFYDGEADVEPPRGRLSVNAHNRSAVADLYATVYQPALNVSIGWTGSINGCVAGTTSAVYRGATLDMVNYFRAMTGLPSAVELASRHVESQAAALMMIAEGSLSHSPSPGWACYSPAGATGAGKSNLALGRHGPAAVDLYMLDSGSFNAPVGHRRWILYPPQVQVGTGSNNGFNGFSGANALWVLGPFGSRPAAPSEVAWPPAGFVPYQVVYPRWSLSLNSAPSASYSNASVSMTLGGTPVALTVVSRIDNGFGDNTIVWEPVGLSFGPGQPDQTVTVRVDNIGGVAQSVEYDVTVIDPAVTIDEIFSDGFESGDMSYWSGG